ncbi:MAG: hypothetical protein N2V78_07925 [Methanophagales archaeon]|nr:hypothetical protein [Methanophagales archaeon]
MTDSIKFGLSEDMIKQILSAVNSPSMRLSSSYDTLTQNLGKDDMEKYISSPAQIDLDSACVTPRKDRLKFRICDTYHV